MSGGGKYPRGEVLGFLYRRDSRSVRQAARRYRVKHPFYERNFAASSSEAPLGFADRFYDRPRLMQPITQRPWASCSRPFATTPTVFVTIWAGVAKSCTVKPL